MYFTSCGKKGNAGPTQNEANSFYSNSNVKVTIIGGIQILANDESIDISLKSSLNKLKESL